jgi:hypothetical protein
MTKLMLVGILWTCLLNFIDGRGPIIRKIPLLCLMMHAGVAQKLLLLGSVQKIQLATSRAQPIKPIIGPKCRSPNANSLICIFNWDKFYLPPFRLIASKQLHFEHVIFINYFDTFAWIRCLTTTRVPENYLLFWLTHIGPHVCVMFGAAIRALLYKY